MVPVVAADFLLSTTTKRKTPRNETQKGSRHLRKTSLPFPWIRPASPTAELWPATRPADDANGPASGFGPDSFPGFVPCFRLFSAPFEPAHAVEVLLSLVPFLIVAAGVLFRVLSSSLADTVFIGANRSKAVLRPARALPSCQRSAKRRNKASHTTMGGK